MYYVATGDCAGPLDTKKFERFEDALAFHRDTKHSHIYTDNADYGTDTGWFDGLTEDEKEQL